MWEPDKLDPISRGGNAALESILKELVRTVVDAVHPNRIILFGSAARGQMGPDSDLDVMIVVSDGSHRRRASQVLYKALAGLGIAKDIVVVTESDLVRYANDPSLVIRPALREGIELYRVA